MALKLCDFGEKGFAGRGFRLGSWNPGVKWGPCEGQGIPPGRQVRGPGDPSFRIWTGWAWAVTGGRAGERMAHVSFQRSPGPFPARKQDSTVKFFTLQFFAHFSSLVYVAFILGRYGRRLARAL